MGDMTTDHEAWAWARSEKVDRLKRALASGELRSADLSTTNAQGRTLLMEAAVHGSGMFIASLCRVEEVDVDAVDAHKNTALILAAKQGKTTCVRALCQSFASVHSTNEDGHTALMVAATAGYKSCVKVLLVNGADVPSTSVSDVSNAAVRLLLQCPPEPKREVTWQAMAACGLSSDDQQLLHDTRPCERCGQVRPYMCECTEHHAVCLSCTELFKTCRVPGCHSPGSNPIFDFTLRRARCTLHGCGWQGVLSQAERHQCQACNVRCGGCGEHMAMEEWEGHWDSGCAKGRCPAPGCHYQGRELWKHMGDAGLQHVTMLMQRLQEKDRQLQECSRIRDEHVRPRSASKRMRK